MKAYISAAAMALVVALSACGGGGSDSSAAPVSAPAVDQVVNVSSSTVNISQSGTYAVNVVGATNTVNVTAGTVTKLTIGGNGNTVNVTAPAAVQAIVFTGDANTVNAPTTFAGTVTDSGKINSVIKK